MSEGSSWFSKVLVATDFSPAGEAAARVGAWVASRSGGPLELVHVVSNVRRALHDASYEARRELLFGDIEVFERDIRKATDAKLHDLRERLALPTAHCETLLGEPFVEVIHAVLKEGRDLVVTGARGLTGWRKFLVGSTAARLTRNCPASVWVVKPEHADPPRRVLAATDLSDVSRRAVEAAIWVAEQASAELCILHVIDADDTTELLEAAPSGTPAGIRRQIRGEARKRLDAFIDALPQSTLPIKHELTSGTPWREINRLAKKHQADLVTLGTVGRSGIPGMLLGNTAEKVLSTCEASLLTVKPIDFVSPIQAPFWPLQPAAD